MFVHSVMAFDISDGCCSVLLIISYSVSVLCLVNVYLFGLSFQAVISVFFFFFIVLIFFSISFYLPWSLLPPFIQCGICLSLLLSFFAIADKFSFWVISDFMLYTLTCFFVLHLASPTKFVILFPFCSKSF